MNNDLANLTVKNTFSFPFKEENFINLSVNIIDNLKISTIQNHNYNLMTEYLKENIKKFKIVGEYEYENFENIKILIVELQNQKVVEKTKSVQKKFAEWFMEKNNCDALLIAFHCNGYKNWRYSLTRLNYSRQILKSGKIKVNKNLSDSRRYSYLVGQNEPNRTAREQITPLLLDECVNPSLEELTKAFSVETLTQNFYNDYVETFSLFEEYINKNIKITSLEARRFTQTLFNRLLLIRFLEKKNWLKIGKSNNYLNELFNYGNYKDKSFYTGRLKPLFFIGLSSEGNQEKDQYGKVCFINGSLFDQTDLDEKIHDIPNKFFKELIGDDGLFYRYNFTIEESTPDDVEVSIDPEMLGKIFEELITSRDLTGAYYTPREIVKFMCNESLKSFFGNSKEKVNKNIINKVKELKILDPACGSGAYLVGMLNELISFIENSASDEDINKKNWKYYKKLEIISSNLYGVDIDEVAVGIARLRLWLSLIVDYEGLKPDPLPNLDFSIEVGDALESPNIRNSSKDLFYEDLINEFKNKKIEYQNAIRKNKKIRLKNEIEAIKLKIRDLSGNTQNTFDWRVEFAEVFDLNEKNGFDIILANPPYGLKVSARIKKNIINNGNLTNDIYAYFILRGLDLVNKNGIFCYIISDTWRTLGTFKYLREELYNQNINFYIDLPGWIFDATVNTNILFIDKSKNHKNIIASDIRNISDSNWIQLSDALNQISNFRETKKSEYECYAIDKNLIKTNNFNFIIGEENLYKKFLSHNNYLYKLADIKSGLTTGDNKYYIKKRSEARGSYEIIEEKEILSNEEINRLSNEEKTNGINPKKYNNKKYIPYDKGGESDSSEGWLPNYYVKTNYFINWSVDSLKRMRTATRATIKRYYKKKITNNNDETSIASYFRNPDFYFKNGITFSRTGIYAPSFRINSNSVFDTEGPCIFLKNNSSNEEIFILGLLCSKLIKFFIKRYLNHTVHCQVDDLKNIPIKDFSKNSKELIIKYTSEIINFQKKNKYFDYRNIQTKIDKLIYIEYDLNNFEISEIERWYEQYFGKFT